MSNSLVDNDKKSVFLAPSRQLKTTWFSSFLQFMMDGRGAQDIANKSRGAHIFFPKKVGVQSCAALPQ
ncbi:MAG: hypothetical protein ACJAS1_004383 [Oleiphilaceae bacterium]|jgi:hypothetical protein